MNYFNEKREKIKLNTVNKLVKDRLLQQVDRMEETVNGLDPVTAEKYVDTLRIIDAIREWQAYVSVLNECAYSDSMLENALKRLTKVAETVPGAENTEVEI